MGGITSSTDPTPLGPGQFVVGLGPGSNALVSDPTKVDAVEKFMIIGDQKFRLDGTIIKTNEGNKIVYSLSPTTPLPTPPSTTPRKNEWFTPNFLAAFTSIMSEIATLMKNIRFNESQFEIKMKELSISLSKELGALAREAKEREADIKVIEAVTNFIQAGVAAAQLGRTMATGREEAKTNDEMTKKYDNKMKECDNQIDALQSKAAVGSGKPPAPLSAADKAEIKKLEDKKAEFEIKRDDAANSYVQKQLGNIQLQSQIMSHVTTGVSKLMEAEETREIGKISEIQQIYQNYLDLARKAADAGQKNASSAEQALAEALRLLDKVVDSHYRPMNG